MGKTLRNNPDPNHVGAFLQRRRQTLGLSQQAVCKKLGGMSPTYYGQVEAGEASMPMATIEKLSKILKFKVI